VIAEPSLDAPDEDWLVWADAMQQIGDPRGELIALGHPDAYIAKHADALLGRSLARHLRKDQVRVSRWRRCYPDEIEIRIGDVNEGPELVSNVFNAPRAARMRSLVVAGVPRDLHSEHPRPVDLAWAIEWICRRDLCPLPPELRELSLVDDRARDVDLLLSRDWNPDTNLVDFGPLISIYQQLPHLEALTVVTADPGQVRFTPIRLPNLRSFTLRCLRWSPGLGPFLANAQWPQLRLLDLCLVESFIDEEPDDTGAYAPIWTTDRARHIPSPQKLERDLELEPLFDSLARLPLERLVLRSFDSADAVVDALLAADLPETLVEIVLADCTLDAAHLEILASLPIRVIGTPARAPRYRFITTRE
jgi:hypothetical protein